MTDDDNRNKESHIKEKLISQIITRYGKRKYYTAKFKVTILKCAEEHVIRKCGGQFEAVESCIRAWAKKRVRLESLQKYQKASRGTLAIYPQMKATFLNWMQEKPQAGIIVSSLWYVFKLENELMRLSNYLRP